MNVMFTLLITMYVVDMFISATNDVYTLFEIRQRHRKILGFFSFVLAGEMSKCLENLA